MTTTRTTTGPPANEREQEREEPTGSRSRETCPSCGGRCEPDERHGEFVCTDCGLVVEEGVVDRGPEWRRFDDGGGNGDERSRVGAPQTQTLHDKGLSSKIGWRNVDASGSRVSSRKRQQLQRLRTWDERFRARDAKDRNLKHALGEIERMASALGLPSSVTETASVIYRRALQADLLPGRSIEAVATAALYAAARQSGVPRSLDEFEPVSRVDRREFARAYRYLASELELALAPPDPVSFLPRYASRLDASDEIERRAGELLEAGKREGVHTGKSPGGMVAAALYAASVLVNEKITQAEVSEALDVSAVTIRKRYTELIEAADGPEA